MAATVSRWNDETKSYAPEVMFEGVTVATHDIYHGDGDSFFYVDYFNVETGEFASYCVGYSPVPTTIDAPADIVAAWEARKVAAQAQAAAARAMDMVRIRIREEQIEAVTPSKGKTVKVVKGRKIPVGTIGTVKVRIESQFGGYSVLLTLADGTEQWTSAGNVEVIPAEALAQAA